MNGERQSRNHASTIHVFMQIVVEEEEEKKRSIKIRNKFKSAAQYIIYIKIERMHAWVCVCVCGVNIRCALFAYMLYYIAWMGIYHDHDHDWMVLKMQFRLYERVHANSNTPKIHHHFCVRFTHRKNCIFYLCICILHLIIITASKLTNICMYNVKLLLVLLKLRCSCAPRK